MYVLSRNGTKHGIIVLDNPSLIIRARTGLLPGTCANVRPTSCSSDAKILLHSPQKTYLNGA